MDIFQIEKSFARQASQRTRVRRAPTQALSRIDFTVQGTIPGMRQHGPMTCWATVATMLLSWRDGSSYDVRQAMSQIGATWQALYEAGTAANSTRGLAGSRKAAFLSAAGLVAEPPVNFAAVGWEHLLRSYGPLWVTTDVNLALPFGVHARVMYGIHGDGTGTGTTVDLINPSTGSSESVTLARFEREFEHEASTPNQPLRIQVVHFPAGARQGRALSLRAKRPMLSRPTCQSFSATEEQTSNSERITFATALNMPTPPELEALMRYLRIDYGDFAPVEARYFEGLKRLLAHHSICTPSDAVNRTNFQDLVKRFQRSKGLTDDGLPGEDTLWEMHKAWADARNLGDSEVEADRVPGVDGFNRFRLRQDIVDRYNAVRADVLRSGGVITSAGSFRALSAEVTPGRSATSMHYSGLALDLSTVSGMQRPDRDPYIITQEGRLWRVFCRTESGAQQTLDAIRYGSHRTTTVSTTARVIDLTEIFLRHGFSRIGPRSNFPADYLSAEWWHFQCEAALTPFLSQFGAELLSLSRYDQAILERNGDIWQNRKRIFKSRRNGWF